MKGALECLMQANNNSALSSWLEMAADRVRCRYPQVSVFRVSDLVLVFRPRFSGSDLGLVSGSVSGFGFHPWISNGYPI